MSERRVTWRNYAAITLLCILSLTVPLGLFGLALHGKDGAIFFAVFGLVLGVLAAAFGSFVAWLSHRHPQSWFLVLIARALVSAARISRGSRTRA